MEGTAPALHLINRGDFMSKLDLKDAFLTVPMQRTLGIYSIFFRGRRYCFNSMPFGLALWAFTKLLKPDLGIFEEERNQANYLFGRHFYSEQLKG